MLDCTTESSANLVLPLGIHTISTSWSSLTSSGTATATAVGCAEFKLMNKWRSEPTIINGTKLKSHLEYKTNLV